MRPGQDGPVAAVAESPDVVVVALQVLGYVELYE